MQTETDEDGVETEVEVEDLYILEFAEEDTDLSYPTTTTTLYANLELSETGELLAPITWDAEDEVDKVSGVMLMYDSMVECTEDDPENATTYKFELSIFCNKHIKGDEVLGNVPAQPLPAIAGVVDTVDGCVKKLHLMHDSGCPTYSAMGFVNFMERHDWIPAFILIGIGIWAGLLGGRFFIAIMSAFGGLLSFMAFMALATVWQRVIYSARDQPDEWNSSASFIISILMGFAISLTVWQLLFAYEKITIYIASVGIGCLTGIALETLIVVLTGWESVGFAFGIMGVFSLVCLFLTKT